MIKLTRYGGYRPELLIAFLSILDANRQCRFLRNYIFSRCLSLFMEISYFNHLER